MDCKRAEALISARMDGERLRPKVEAALERHVASCLSCTRFTEGAWRIREAVRFKVMGPVPDLVERIMAGVREEAGAPGPGRLRLRPDLLPLRPRPSPLGPPGPRRRWRTELARLAAALLAGAVVGSTIVAGGLWPARRSDDVAVAADIPGRVIRAAIGLDAYHARFTLVERNFRPEVPFREFTVSVWFVAPERFRMEVVDHTAYPDASWPRNDLSLIVDGSSWYAAGPPPCPPQALPGCPTERREVRVDNRSPFSESAPIPADLVLPVATLADADRLTLLGRGVVGGRSALRVELAFRDARPLFPFLRQGGAWRPFFPEDRVVLWLDAGNWFPLQYRVFPADDPDRGRWATRNGLPPESPGREVLSASMLSLDVRAPDPATFTVPAGPAEDHGARPTTLEAASRAVGYEPVIPGRLEGLALYRVVLPPRAPEGPPDETLVTFSRGLAWLKIQQTRSWRGDDPYGPVGTLAEVVTLPNGAVGLYEPATEDQGRRLSIHAEGLDLYLETNLPREELLAIAASLPVRAATIPEAWLVRTSGRGEAQLLPLDAAIRAVPFPVALPEELPAGFRLARAELVEVGGSQGLNLYFQPEDADLVESRIRLHLEPRAELPPASSAAQSAVDVGGREGRWTPSRHQLEWVGDGVYHSLDAPGLGLEELLAIARSLAPVEEP